MKIELRYCKKCKRDTIQVVQKVMSWSAEVQMGEIRSWARKTGSKLDLDAEEENLKCITYYCPNCGNEWLPTEETTTKYQDVKVNFTIYKRWDVKENTELNHRPTR